MKRQLNPTIKAHLTRGAFYLLLLVTLCAIPFALAQRNTMKRTAAKAKTAPAIKLAATGTRSAAAASLAGVTQQKPAMVPRSQGEAPNDAVPFFAGARVSHLPLRNSGAAASHAVRVLPPPKAPQV